MSHATINNGSDRQARRDVRRAFDQFQKFLQKLPEEISNDLKDLFQMLAKAKSEGDTEHLRSITQAIREILLPDSLKVAIFDDEQFEDDAEVRAKVDHYRRCIGEAIRKKRDSRRMTQQQLAKKAGIPQSHVSRLEVGKHVPTHVTIQKIAKALRTRPSQLDPGFSDE